MIHVLEAVGNKLGEDQTDGDGAVQVYGDLVANEGNAPGAADAEDCTAQLGQQLFEIGLQRERGKRFAVMELLNKEIALLNGPRQGVPRCNAIRNVDTAADHKARPIVGLLHAGVVCQVPPQITRILVGAKLHTQSIPRRGLLQRGDMGSDCRLVITVYAA